jgi:hypothetical protein
MGSLGSFGVEPATVEVVTFEYFGHTIRVAPDFGEVAFIDWMEEWGQIDEKDPRSAIGGKALMRAAVHAEDFAEFWALARANRQGVEQLLELVGVLVKAATDRPTGLPTDSRGGLENTPPRSEGNLSSAQVMRDLAAGGRPDLANVVLLAHEHGAA